MARKLAAGNWKMNGLRASLAELRALAAAEPAPDCGVLICPPATLLAAAAETLADTPFHLGGQDCHPDPSGAHTGDISAAMLADAGASHVIVGHSERRADHGETDALVAAKARAAHTAGLTAVICLGETEAERDAGETLAVIGGQLAGSLPATATAENTVIAYEPVWAIGTGRTPTIAQIAEVHDFLRNALADRLGKAAGDMPLLYGGSVKPSNADDIFAVENVDGALVGGASLKAADFGAIIAALARA
ncbi:MAG: triose-phosphate isomerase [Paracoccaceae bacterium]